MCDDCEINNMVLVEYLMFPGVYGGRGLTVGQK